MKDKGCMHYFLLGMEAQLSGNGMDVPCVGFMILCVELACLFQSHFFSNYDPLSTARQLFAWTRRWGLILVLYVYNDVVSRTKISEEIPRGCGRVQTLRASFTDRTG